jgi:hypothetical protein
MEVLQGSDRLMKKPINAQDPKYPNNLARTISNVLAVRVQPFPLAMSAGCKLVISGLLQKDPSTRTTLIVRFLPKQVMAR